MAKVINESKEIAQKLNFARKELLDLSLKNPLLNYKQRISSGLELPFLNISDVFNYIVNEGKKTYFTTEKSNNPSKLYVDATDKELHKKLLRTYRSGKMYIEERGANILFLALGFLKWNNIDEEEDVFHRAPLILVPVEFIKSDGLDKFYLKYSGEEIRLNISLITKLKNDFSIDIDYQFDEEIHGIDEYLRKVDEVISTSSKHGWQVELNCGAFDFFSYAKFLMYKDLDISQWCDDKKKINNKILRKLFFEDFTDNTQVDCEPKNDFNPAVLHTVVDADSSQFNVIYQIKNGKNMVIQGPPGTGKSQTISNIIASSVAEGKSILFVSEKKAALDVVKSRLEKVGLGDLVLELHSHKSNKVDVLSSIENTLNLGEPKVFQDDLLKNKYFDAQKEINEYRDLVTMLVAKSNLTLIEIYGKILQIREKIEKESTRLVRLTFTENLCDLNEKEFNEKLLLIKEFINLLKTAGKIEKHTFYGVELKNCMPYEQVIIKEKLYDIEDALNSFLTINEEISSIFGNKSCITIFDSLRLINSIEAIGKYKDTLQGLSCFDTSFITKESKEIINCGIKCCEFKKNLPKYRENSHLEYDNFISLWTSYIAKRGDGDKEGKEEIKSELAKFMQDGKFNRNDLQEYFEFVKNVKEVLDNSGKLKRVFETVYVDALSTDWQKLNKIISSCHNLLNDINDYKILSQTKKIISSSESVNKLLELKEEYIDKCNEFKNKIEDFVSSINFDYTKRFDTYDWWTDMNFYELKKIISSWKSKVDSVVEVVHYNDLVEKFKNSGLQILLDYYETTGKYEHLDDIFANEYYDSLINYAYSKTEYLSRFKEYKLERVIDVFKSLDNKLMAENIKEILKNHYNSMPRINEESKEMNILRREIQKNKNQLPVAKLFSKVGTFIQRIKPVFMMSPISVASFLPAISESFDLVIFDEASQVRPVEAFGALLRAKQIVVVGDSKQLPPTSFFDTLTTKYDDVNDEDYDIVNMESILSLLLSKNIPETTLNWHYRSRNQSLISVSNNEFYNQSLKVFPSVYDRDPNQGLIFKYNKDTYYQRGGSRTNPLEAKAVISAVFEHIAKFPNMSIGIVSFSLAQQEVLYKEFDEQRKLHTAPVYEEYFSSQSIEPIFIKNLESVQGDERDVIFISITYGFDENKKISMDFGPLNKEGGERRLNVLITRAKYKCIVFSNITSHDINLTKTSAAGVVALKRFLEYAQDRIIFISKNQEANNNAFVDYLTSQLGEYGYDVDRNIGAKVGIDLAVYNKDLKRFTIGIECDGGASKDIYLPTDRERIRINILKSLGWRVYHIWAPDFYRNPKNEFLKLLDFIENVTSETQENIESAKAISISRKAAVKLKKSETFIPYKQYSGPKRRAQILDNIVELKSLVAKIVHIETPININALKKTLCLLTNSTKLSDEQHTLLFSCISDNPNLKLVDDFVYEVSQNEFKIRNREELPKAFKKAEYIPKEEYLEYLKKVLITGDALRREDVYKHVNDYLGISKTQYSKDILDALINKLVDDKVIVIEKDILSIND